MPTRTRQAKVRKSSMRSALRTIGIARARVKMGLDRMANIIERHA